MTDSQMEAILLHLCTHAGKVDNKLNWKMWNFIHVMEDLRFKLGQKPLTVPEEMSLTN